ncbi:MAG TPA: hypothetical protein VHP58_05505 [Alphaproteobacteria bacterium]|nr:hypothetical protein [Alphaproteobacteria bacterium]
MPRKPDPATPKRPVGRPKGTTKIARQQAEMAQQASAAGVQLPLVPKKVNLSPYPDLSMAIAMLRYRQAQVDPQRADLIKQWLASLTDIHTSITKLKKLEILSESLTSAGK